MSRILFIGYDPPSFVRNAKVEAAHYRTAQLLLPILDDGHTVCFCSAGSYPENTIVEVPDNWGQHLTCCPVSFSQPGWVRDLQRIHDTFHPDCVVAVNFDCCLYATKLHSSRPIWMDIYGDMLTVIQAACYRARSDRGLTTSISFVLQVLEKGDIFSVCSTPQKHMLVGELAMAGRLNQHSFGYEFVRVVLPGAQVVEPQAMCTKESPLFVREGIRSDDFVVLWCGGYNTWTHVDTLFKALEKAMAEDQRVHFVSVGANTYEAPDNVYAQLLSMIAQSRYRERFHMLGWRPYQEVGEYYRASHVGLNIDAWHYETVYGTRTRLLEMMASGLPVITTLGCELSYLLEEAGAGFTFPIGDWQMLARDILFWAQQPERRQASASAAYHLAENELSFYATTAPLREWVQCAQGAPDKFHPGFQERLRGLEHKGRATLRQTVWYLLGARK